MKGLMIFKVTFIGLLLTFSQLGLADEQELDLLSAVESEQVNINRADAETIALMLNGIGISRAEAIVTYREENGLFSSLDDLVMVIGVGELTVLRNKNIIVFE